MTLKEQIMRLQTYKMFEGEDTVYVERDDVMKLLEQEPRWIPVSERLPEENIAVLVWCPERKNIYCAYFSEKQWWIFGAYKVLIEVVAWMPLPKPYKAESEE